MKNITRSLVSLLRRKIEDLPVPQQTKIELVKVFQDYRRKVTTAFIEEGVSGHDVSLVVVLKQREGITGTVYVTLIRMLNLVHDIEPFLARKIERIFACWGLSLQVSDDILDFTDDQDNIQNLIVSIARKYPGEKDCWQVKRRVTQGWAKRKAPLILRETRQVLESYFRKMLDIDLKHPVTQVMIVISRAIFRSVLSHFPRYFYKF